MPKSVRLILMQRMLHRILGAALFAFFACSCLFAQSNVPIISGGVQFLSTTSGGATVFQPLIAPVIVAPIGDHWLFQSRATFDEVIFRENGSTGPYHALTSSSVDYLQLNYIANPHLTVTVGEFLTPFNIYNERLGAVWIHNLANAPLIAGIGTRTSGSSQGGMLSGVALERKDWQLNYTAYFSSLVNNRHIGSGRSAGGRIGVFVPRTRLEVGLSYQRFLQDQHVNSWGTYVVWQPNAAPLDLRAEYAHTRGGQGYWIEGAYRFSRFRGSTDWLGRLQAVARMQQFFLGKPTPDDVNPGADAQEFDFGLNYYLPHNLRLNTSYGRQFSSLGNANIWNIQITYRFLFPLIPGESK